MGYQPASTIIPPPKPIALGMASVNEWRAAYQAGCVAHRVPILEPTLKRCSYCKSAKASIECPNCGASA